ncbi:hypothetical protein ACFLYS_02760 [Chloroflexota bacterium]
MFRSHIFRIILSGICSIIIVSAAFNTAPVRADEEIWKLDKTIITPSEETFESDDGYHSWTASSTRLSHLFTFPNPPIDNYQHFDFSAPPEELVPGKTIQLKVTGTGGGSDPTISYEQFQFRSLLTTEVITDIVDYVIASEELASLSMGSMYGVGPEDAIADFLVPPVSDDTLYITASLTTSGSIPGWGCTVRWTYKRGKADDTPAEATLFTGYALAYDDNNRVIPIVDASVRLRLERDGDVAVIDAITGTDGLYAIAVKGVTNKTVYQVQLNLVERTGVYLVNWYPELRPASYLTAAREVGPDSLGNLVIANLLFEPRMPQGEPSWVADDGSLVGIPQRTVGQDRSGALVYARIYKAMTYGRDRLEVTYDLNLPVTIVLDAPSTGSSRYTAAYGQIDITADDLSKVLINEADQPEWHEFGHFLSHDSPWLGDNIDFPVPDVGNHAGVRNASSGDSVVEGAAEFLVLLFKGVAARTDDQVPYDISGFPINLQDNVYEDYIDATGERIPSEEWQFAALLWDIMDEDINPEAGDEVAWGLSRLWDVLVTVTDPTIRAHYVALKAEAGEPLPGPQTPTTPLDNLFILHGFYANTNGIAGWQQGEPIGYPDSWNTRANPTSPWGPTQDPVGVRFTPAVPRYMWFEPLLAPGVPSPLKAEMTVYPSAGGVPWSITLTADENGRFPLTVPASADRIQLQLISPGFQISPVSFTRAAYNTAVEEGNELITIEPVVLPSQVNPPTGFSVQRTGSSPATLAWSPSPGTAGVIVVRGSTCVPVNPRDGKVIYGGTGTSVQDTDPIPAGSSYYAVFAVGEDGGVSAPATATSVAGVIQPSPATTVPPTEDANVETLPQLPQRLTPTHVSQIIRPEYGGVNWYFIAGGITFLWLIVLLVRRKKKQED